MIILKLMSFLGGKECADKQVYELTILWALGIINQLIIFKTLYSLERCDLSF